MRDKLDIDLHGRSETGRGRGVNGDHFLVADMGKSMLIHHSSLPMAEQTRLIGRRQGLLMVVADGMGGLDGGDEASALAVRTVSQYVLNTMPWFYRLDVEHEDDLRDELAEALRKCEKALREERRGQPSFATRLGATLTMAYVLWPNLYSLHVGDGRCAVLREGRLRQVTTDHTVAELLRDGQGPRDGLADPTLGRNLWNVIDTDEGSTAVPEVRRVRLRPGDDVILATDGLAAGADRDAIATLVDTSETAESATDALVDAAKQGGSRDDITVVVARFRPTELQTEA